MTSSDDCSTCMAHPSIYIALHNVPTVEVMHTVSHRPQHFPLFSAFYCLPIHFNHAAMQGKILHIASQ